MKKELIVLRKQCTTELSQIPNNQQTQRIRKKISKQWDYTEKLTKARGMSRTVTTS